MQLLFVTKVGDKFGEFALNHLAARHQVRILEEGEKAPAESIALFTTSSRFQGSAGRFLRCSARKLIALNLVPDWAATTPFVVGVIRIEQLRGNPNGFAEALRVMAGDYAGWDPSVSLVPWASYEKDPKVTPDSECMELTRQWRNRLTGINIIIRRIEETPKDYRTVRINAWNVNFSDEVRVFSDQAVQQSLALLSRWQSSFAQENTWSQRELGTPSLVVRLDCVVHDGVLTVYEVEERPSGMGVSSLANPFFKDRLGQIVQTWPDFRVVISDQRSGTDDHIWMDALNRPICRNAELVLVRAEPEETEFHHLEEHSVSSLIAKGNKSYGETLGLWQRVQNAATLPWDRGFVLKPKQGSKMHDVEIWDPLKRPGSAVRSRIEGAIKHHGSMFLQKLVDPMDTGNPEFSWMIYRVFFGFNTKTSAWECLGGNWNARSNLRIHGASDALFGPVVLR